MTTEAPEQRRVDPAEFTLGLTQALRVAGWHVTGQYWERSGAFHTAWTRGADTVTDWQHPDGRELRITGRPDGGVQVQTKRLTIGLWPDTDHTDLFELIMIAAIGGLRDAHT